MHRNRETEDTPTPAFRTDPSALARRRLIAIGLGLPACMFRPADAGVGWPDGPVRLVVLFPPGGGMRSPRSWRQACRAPGVLMVSPHIHLRMGFDPLEDMAPVSLATVQPFVLVAHPSLRAGTLADLAALARRQPGSLAFASPASGPQMAVEQYKRIAGVDLLHVAYKGAGPAVVDALAGNVPLLVSKPASVATHGHSGKLRGIVVFGDERIDALPWVPTTIESGFPGPGRNPEWQGIGVSAGTPASIVRRIQVDLPSVLDSADARAAIRGLDLAPEHSTPEAFSRRIRADHAAWGHEVRAAVLRPGGG